MQHRLFVHIARIVTFVTLIVQSINQLVGLKINHAPSIYRAIQICSVLEFVWEVYSSCSFFLEFSDASSSPNNLDFHFDFKKM